MKEAELALRAMALELPDNIRKQFVSSIPLNDTDCQLVLQIATKVVEPFIVTI